MTGWSTGLSTDNNFATVAYDTTTGQELWAKRYDGPGDYIDRAYDAATGDQLWFKRYNGPGDFSASTGERLWTGRYNDPVNGDDRARVIALSPDGSKVFITGRGPTSTGFDYTTIAYSA